ncbi:MAG: exonuclease domain-containing protein [Lachnospiraceae bacterium]|nr:exonuclease domain-containing protein [Lachnospiraceae bacterium]
MNYIVFDLEWNQSSARQSREYGLPFEILEIGAIKLNKRLKVIDQFQAVIKPQIYHYIHHITTKIIHLTEEELQNGKPFPVAMNEFLTWCGRDFVFCIWGTSDITELQRNMMYYGMDMLADGPLLYCDIQKFFSIAYEDGKKRRALETAVDFLGIEKDHPFHGAYDDAYYTAKVFKRINSYKPRTKRYVSYDVFIAPRTEKDEIEVNFKTYAKYISREFPDKTVAIEDKKVSEMKCYKCGRAATPRIKWFSVNGKHYYCVSYCKRHGFLKGKVRMKKTDDGSIYVVKTTKLVTKEVAQEIAKKQDKLRLQRMEKRRAKKN